MKPLIAGNWKMNGLQESLTEGAALIDRLGGRAPDYCEALICPPATILAALSDRLAASGVATGGQDCHAAPDGAHTGDIAAEMLRDAGASYVIVGHSERRADHGETDARVRAKAAAAVRAGLAPIVCVGETRAEREAGAAETIVSAQLAGSAPLDAPGLVIAYEPVWAIGSGATPTPDEIAAMHALIRSRVGEGVRILYGGSVKPSNAAEILRVANVNGALVGGASLRAADFHAIVAAAG